MNETPKQEKRGGLRHTPTPKMSERKRTLFARNNTTMDFVIDEDSDLGPMSPLHYSSSPVRNEAEPTSHSVLSFSQILSENVNHSNIANVQEKQDPKETDKDLLIRSNNKLSAIFSETELEKENQSIDSIMKTPNERPINCKDLRISFKKSLILGDILTPTRDGNEELRAKKWLQKRHHEGLSSLADSPMRKVLKIDSKGTENSKARTSLSFEPSSIPSKSFYGSGNTTGERPKIKRIMPVYKTVTKKSRTTRNKFVINKGVGHKIVKAKPSKNKNQSHKISKEKLLKTAISLVKGYNQNSLTEKLNISQLDVNGISAEQIKRVNNILRNLKNPIEMARPLNVVKNEEGVDNSENDTDTDHSMDQETDQDHEEEAKNNKFFKSRSTRQMRYQLTTKLTATVKRGRMTLDPVKQKKKKLQPTFDDNQLDDFEEEHLEVDDIITRLCADDSKTSTNLEDNLEMTVTSENADDEIEKFKQLIPYNTTDPEVIERQQTILELLINNNICTAENIKFFITEPDLYKEEASRILDQLICVSVDKDYESGSLDTPPSENAMPVSVQVNSNQQSSQENIMMSPTSQISNMTNDLLLGSPKRNSTDQQSSSSVSTVEVSNTGKSEKLYSIFYKNPENQSSTNNTMMVNVGKSRKRRLWKPIGDNQYQIDAGQKKFGATYCSECDLIYTAHEPEEEILHSQFHNSLNLLKFKGWQHENIVKRIPEWDATGRIICVQETDNKIKLYRITNILKTVDNHLGCSEQSMPPKSVTYLAIAKNIIMGLCVAHPITTASRIYTKNEVDYFSEKKYPALCGIAKIWVASPYRRQGVAKYLINAIQGHFCFGHYLDMDEIAFSSPTDAGKLLAKNLSNRSDFLVY